MLPATPPTSPSPTSTSRTAWSTSSTRCCCLSAAAIRPAIPSPSPGAGDGEGVSQVLEETALRPHLTSLAILVALAACGGPSPADFAGATPQFEPEKFFAGHVRSWGVIENRSGAPTSRFTTESAGHRDGDSLVIAQHLGFDGGRSQDRIWHLRRLDAHRYEATADDVVGTATGSADGNAFRWDYTLALSPGNTIDNVQMTQWMYGVGDGSRMMNRVTVKKLGFIVAEATEFFTREPD